VAHPSSDFSQCPSLNDQRRISTTEPPIGVDVKVELSAPPPDAAPQRAPVDPTTLVPSAKSFELMRQLEALAHEVAVVSRRDSSDQCIQDGSNLSAGLQLVEPSIRVSPHDHLASDSPSFGRRTILTLVGFFTVARDWLASHRPSFGRPSAALAALGHSRSINQHQCDDERHAAAKIWTFFPPRVPRAGRRILGMPGALGGDAGVSRNSIWKRAMATRCSSASSGLRASSQRISRSLKSRPIKGVAENQKSEAPAATRAIDGTF
jgi:hypothetical protein